MGSGFRVWESGLRVERYGVRGRVRVQGTGSGLGLRVEGPGYRVQGLG